MMLGSEKVVELQAFLNYAIWACFVLWYLKPSRPSFGRAMCARHGNPRLAW